MFQWLHKKSNWVKDTTIKMNEKLLVEPNNQKGDVSNYLSGHAKENEFISIFPKFFFSFFLNPD